MDRWLDEVARALAKGASRKEFLKLLGAGAAGLLLPRTDDASAKQGKSKKSKGKHKGGDDVCQVCGGPGSPFCCGGICCAGECCNGSCCSFGPCCNGICCLGSGQICQNNQCVDPVCATCGGSSSSSCCNGNCCLSPSTCQNNQCVAPTCLNCGGSSSPSCCGGVCRDTSLDDDNCGACSHSCKGAAQCFGGRCVCPAKKGDFLPFAPRCDDPDMLCCASEDGDTAACINIRNDDKNCGGCRIDCTKSGQKCVDKVCVGDDCNSKSGSVTCKTICCPEATYPNGGPIPPNVCCAAGLTVCCISSSLITGMTTSKCCPPSNPTCCKPAS